MENIFDKLKRYKEEIKKNVEYFEKKLDDLLNWSWENDKEFLYLNFYNIINI
jgi:uncharacterized protein Yka (UPF0111/DUF47 family)